MNKPVRNVVIVGGGSAGWLTAGLLAAEFRGAGKHGIQVTLIESPDIRAIGVGEGTWPTMRDSLRRIGISEHALFAACDASFKQGSKFIGWVSGGERDYYYHPFVVPQGYGEANLAAEWQARHHATPFADLVSFQPHLCENGKAPKQAATPEFAAVANYAYHLDAGKFGEFLRDYCIEQLGVTHRLDHVQSVLPADNGDIAALQTERHGRIDGDLFIDCSGFSSLLLGDHYGVPFVSRKDVLFNDTALAVQLPHDSPAAPIASQTNATAQGAGWIWDIALPTRRGIGYVYSSDHSDDATAQAALEQYLGQCRHADQSAMAPPRLIRFEPGHRERFWHRNCVAIGLAAGFLEPLEASALVLVELSATMLCDDFPFDRDSMDIVARRFNERFAYRWDRIVEFLKLHYLLSQRTDSDYWRENRDSASIPVRLQEQLLLWRQQPPSRYDFYQIEEVFPAASYQYVLFGMGFRLQADRLPRASDRATLADRCFRDSAAHTAKLLAGLPTNRELVEHYRAAGGASRSPASVASH